MKIATVLSAALVALLATAPAPAQEGPDMAGFEQKVFRLAHTQSCETASILQGFLTRGRVACEERTNAVVISAPPGEIEMATKLIDALDVEGADAHGESSAIIRVGPAAPPDLMALIRTLVSSRTDAALDQKTGILALRGPTGDINEVQKLIESLPQAGAAAPEQALSLSFYFVQGMVDVARPAPPPAVAEARPADPRDIAVQEALDQLVDLNLAKVPLSEAIRKLASAAKFDAVVHWIELESLGVQAEAPITVELAARVPARQALELVLGAVGNFEPRITYAVKEGVVHISSQSVFDRERQTEVYDVSDLISPDLVSLLGENRQPSHDHPISGFKGEDRVYRQDVPALDADRPVMWTPRNADAVDALIHLITNTVDSQSWDERGGDASVQEFNGLLVVTHNARGQQAVAELLDLLRTRHAAARAAVSRISMPAELEPVIASLNENGIHNATLLAPLRVAAANRGVFELEGSAAQMDRVLDVKVKGHVAMRDGESVPAAQLNAAKLKETLARTELERSRDAHARTKKLFEQGVVSRAELDEAARQQEAAEAQYLAAQSEQRATAGAAGGTVELQVNAEVGPKVALPGTLGGPEPMFRLNCSVTAPIGDYVVLATSPGATDYGQAIALVVRVDAAQ